MSNYFVKVVLEKLQIIADATRADFAAAAADLNASSSSSSLPKKVKAFSGVLVVTPQIRPSTGSPNAIAPLGSSVAPSASNSSASTSNSAEPPPASVAPSASNSAEPAPPAKRCRSADEIAPPALQADRLFSIPLSDPKAIGNPLGDPKAVRVLNIPAGDQKAVSVIRYSPGLTQAQNLPVPARDSLNVDTKTPPCFQPLPSVGCLSRTALTNDPFLSGLGNHFFVQWMMKQKK